MLTFDKVRFKQGAFELLVDQSVEAGGVVAVLGPSGAGKSTMLHGIAGFVEQVSGNLEWNGVGIGELAPQDRPVSMLFQDNNLFPHLTVMQNVALALAPKLNVARDVQSKVEGMLEQVGLNDVVDRKPSALSGGQQSRVSLARALLQDRAVMLMDEPFSALGPALKNEMLDLSVRLAKGRTVIMITHDPADAARVADTVIGVASGRALPAINTDGFLANPPDELREYFMFD